MKIFSIILLISAFICIVSAVYKKYMFEGFEYNCFFSTDEASEGDEIEFTEELSNNKFLPIPWMKSEFTTSKWLEFSGFQSTVSDKTRYVTSFFALNSWCKIKRVWKVKCLKRGCYTVDSVILLGSDTLGIIKLTCRINQEQLSGIKLTVLPSFTEYTNDNDLTVRSFGDIFIRNSLIADPFYKNGIREYSITDSFRDINWYATAVQQKLMVNRHDFTTDRTVSLILNMQSTIYDVTEVIHPNVIEKCIRICAALIRDLTAEGIPVRLLANTSIDNLAADVTSADCNELYRILANIQMNITASFEKYIPIVLNSIYTSEIIIISAYESDILKMCQSQRTGISIMIPYIDGGDII